MDHIPEEITRMAASGEVKLKITKPQEVVYTVHKGSYQRLGEVFEKLFERAGANGYEIVGPSVTIFYNDPRTTPEDDLISECQFPVMRRTVA